MTGKKHLRYFYAPDLTGDRVQLDEGESRHLKKVMRARVGDNVHLLDGKGGVAQGRITALGGSCMIELDAYHIEDPPRQQLSIAVAPPKAAPRLNWMIEKCAELGVAEIILIQTQRSERRRTNIERMQKIALAAMKQCGSAYLLEISEMTGIPQLIKSAHHFTERFVCQQSASIGLAPMEEIDGGPRLVVIGPEGGFEIEEVELLQKAEFTPVYLSKNRLRTETACIASAVLSYAT